MLLNCFLMIPSQPSLLASLEVGWCLMQLFNKIWSYWPHRVTGPIRTATTRTTTTTTVLWPFFLDHPGEPVLEQNFCTLWCKGRLTQADTQTIRLGATPSRLTSAHLHHPPFFYRLDALPAAQPTVSKHCRQLAHLDYGEDARVLLSGVTCTVSVHPDVIRSTAHPTLHPKPHLD